MKPSPVLGIDIGGTKLAAGVVEPNGNVLSYLREPTPTNLDPESLFAFTRALAERACQQSPQAPKAIGIGSGGPMIFPEGKISPLHIPTWRNFPLRARLEADLHLPTILDNDAKAFALGEALFGAGQGAQSLLGIVVSTGVGGGIVVAGRLLDGASGNAGHIGHAIVAVQGPRCPCGSNGCVTVYASGTGLVARASAALKRRTPSLLANLPHTQLTGATIAAAAAAGDPLAVKLMHDAALALARGIASAANILDLDRVVIGGGIAQAGDLLFTPLRQEVQRRATLDFSRNLPILPAALGQKAGVIGAAALVFQDRNTSSELF